MSNNIPSQKSKTFTKAESLITLVFIVVAIIVGSILVWLGLGKWLGIGIIILVIIAFLVFLLRKLSFPELPHLWKKILWWILALIIAAGLVFGGIKLVDWWYSPSLVEGGTEPACKTDPNLIIEELRIGKNILDTGISYHYYHDKTGSFSSVDFKTIPGCTDTLSIRGREHEVNATSRMEFTFNSIGDPIVIYENRMDKGGNYYLTVHKPITIDVVKN